MTTPPRAKRTLIEEGTEFKGSMSSNCPIVVMGKIEGDIAGPEIEISPSGVVAGTVKVKELRSEGELAGDIGAEVVHLSGKVRENTVIRAHTLEVHLHRADKAMEVVFGSCELQIGDEPNKEAAIEAAVSRPEPDAVPAVVVEPATAQAGDAWEEPRPKGRSRTRTAPPPT